MKKFLRKTFILFSILFVLCLIFVIRLQDNKVVTNRSVEETIGDKQDKGGSLKPGDNNSGSIAGEDEFSSSDSPAGQVVIDADGSESIIANEDAYEEYELYDVINDEFSSSDSPAGQVVINADGSESIIANENR